MKRVDQWNLLKHKDLWTNFWTISMLSYCSILPSFDVIYWCKCLMVVLVYIPTNIEGCWWFVQVHWRYWLQTRLNPLMQIWNQVVTVLSSNKSYKDSYNSVFGMLLKVNNGLDLVKVDEDFIKDLCGIDGYKANKWGTSLIIMTLTNKQNLHWCTLLGMHLCVYIYIYIYLQEKGTPGANHGPREVSVHSEEQHTGSKDSEFDCFIYHHYNLHF